MIGKSQKLQVIDLLNALMLITKVVHGLTETHPKFNASDSLRFRLSHTCRYIRKFFCPDQVDLGRSDP